MLVQRIITALLMVAVLLPILFHSDPSALAGLSVLLMALAGWEWGRLNGLAFRSAVAIGLSCFLACLITQSFGLIELILAVITDGFGS